jgi:ubiquinone/menaquinone biosynthesis C-methylase UbiE
MKEITDNFSANAQSYALFRPSSPAGIFEFLYQHTANFDVAWDCGTGNGQVAGTLAEKFGKVLATDISTEQMKLALTRPNITYMHERAEATSLQAGSVDLVTVAQAIHWFDFDRFYEEVYRVCRPGALIAAWTYTVLQFTPEVDAVIDELYSKITRPYWDKERRYVDARYQTIPFPFEEIANPGFQIQQKMTLEHLLGYLRTWSGVKHYIQKEKVDPVSLVADKLAAAWGPEEQRDAVFPIHMRAGRVS